MIYKQCAFFTQYNFDIMHERFKRIKTTWLSDFQLSSGKWMHSFKINYVLWGEVLYLLLLGVVLRCSVSLRICLKSKKI